MSLHCLFAKNGHLHARGHDYKSLFIHGQEDQVIILTLGKKVFIDKNKTIKERLHPRASFHKAK
jgi:hypothetical protein